MSDENDRQGSLGDIGGEAARLIGAVQQRVMRGVMSTAASASMAAGSRDRDRNDVWSRATAEPEDETSPLDRLVDFSKVAAPRVAGHLFQAGNALLAAARDIVDAYQETRPAGPAPDAPDPSRFVDAGSGRSAAGRPAPGDGETGTQDSRTDGDPWAAASDDVPARPSRRRDDPDDGIEHIDIG